MSKILKKGRKVYLENFPYFSQLDNKFNPYGSCNVTSASMVLHHLGIRGDGSHKQLEDQLYQRLLDNKWSRHSPYDLKKVMELYPGIKDDFTERGTLQDIKNSIDSGKPVILHGYFTRFGHIVCCFGYSDQHLIINDPYGEWFPSGYRTDLSGKNNLFLYKTIAQLCSPESPTNPKNIFMHSVSRS